MNVDGAYKKKERNIENIRHRHSLLLQLIESPEKTNAQVRNSLVNQKSFSSLSLPSNHISPISLNTTKSLCGFIFPRSQFGENHGFPYFDSLRLKLSSKLQPSDIRKGNNKFAKLERQISEGKSKIAFLEKESLIRSRAYADLFSEIRTLIDANEIGDIARLRLDALLRNSFTLYNSLLSPVDNNQKRVSLVRR